MLSIIINYIKKLFYGEPCHPKPNDTFVYIPTNPALSSEALADGFSPRVKSIEHLNQIKNFEFKKNRHYYFKY